MMAVPSATGRVFSAWREGHQMARLGIAHPWQTGPVVWGQAAAVTARLKRRD